MVDREPGLVLPLMHHLVQQRVQGLCPSIAPKVPPADRDLRRLVRRCRGVVAQPALHATRYADLNRRKTSMKVPSVVARVPLLELRGRGLVVRVRAFLARRTRRRRNRMRHDHALRRATLSARPCFHKADNRAMNSFWCVEKAFVDAELAAAEAHQHVPVVRELRALDAAEPEVPEPREKFAGVAWDGMVETEVELRRVMSAAEEPSQRVKHLVGPGTKLRSEVDHTSVETSILSGEMRMLFTEDGRPPRILFDTVPAVEITVPFFVCSM